MKRVLIDIEGRPKGKGRPRFSGHAYTPESTREYEGKVRGAYYRKYGSKMIFQHTPVMVTIIAYYPVPKNASKDTRRQMLQGDLMPVLTPDIDNIVKIIMDGLNRTAYQDDKQVVAVVARKRYDITGHVTVMVEGMPK